VKLRGFRIELGEIEAALHECPGIRKAVVLMREDENRNKQLIAYIVVAEAYDEKKTMEHVGRLLPEHMVPSLLVEIEKIPLTENDKVDRKKLAALPLITKSGKEYVAPRNQLEESLALIWQDLLGLERVGINDNFFELGGDSIVTIQVVSRARKIGYLIQVGDLFVHQTIGRLSAEIAARIEANIGGGEQGVLSGECGLLPIQQWFLEQNLDNTGYFTGNRQVDYYRATQDSLSTDCVAA
jgi:hypothetical protein